MVKRNISQFSYKQTINGAGLRRTGNCRCCICEGTQTFERSYSADFNQPLDDDWQGNAITEQAGGRLFAGENNPLGTTLSRFRLGSLDTGFRDQIDFTVGIGGHQAGLRHIMYMRHSDDVATILFGNDTLRTIYLINGQQQREDFAISELVESIGLRIKHVGPASFEVRFFANGNEYAQGAFSDSENEYCRFEYGVRFQEMIGTSMFYDSFEMNVS